jgi:anti-sigma factor RsiW
MNCREIESLAPLYLSGELEESQREHFRAHLAECRVCASEIDRDRSLDDRLRDAASMEIPDSAPLEAAVGRRIRFERARKMAAVAAAVLFAATVSYWALRPKPVSRIYTDAALDHRLEVMEHQQRRWRTSPSEIDKLGARFDLSNLAALAPAGYRLDRAKICGIDGKPTLHLVYVSGNRELSLYIRPAAGKNEVLEAATVGSEHLAGFHTNRFEAVVATAGSSGECLNFARFASALL